MQALSMSSSRAPGSPGAAAEAELRHLRASQERAVNEALRTAWEEEVRERRETEAKLRAVEATWLPLREWLVKLTAVAHRGRAGLLAASPGLAPGAVPAPPTEAAWCQDSQLPDVARALCDCLEALSAESLRAPKARAGHPRRWMASPAPGEAGVWSPSEPSELSGDRRGTNGVSTNGVTTKFMLFDRGTFLGYSY